MKGDARLTRSCIGALDQLAMLAEQRAEWEPAITDIQRIIQLDPLAEQAQQRLVALYVRSGSPGLARQHYQQFERTYARSWVLHQRHKTQAARRWPWNSNAPISSTPPQPGLRSATSFQLPFVGRKALLAQLDEIAQAVCAGRSATVLLQGTAGIDKSWLVDELLAALATGSTLPSHV